MATTGRSSSALLSSSTGPSNHNKLDNHHHPNHNPEDEDLWSTILSEVSTHSRSKLPSGKNVLVMGEVGSGKTTLVAKLQGIEEYMKGRGLEYLYFSVHDDDIDDHTRCNVWVLDGDLYHKGLQGVAVPVDSIEGTLLVVTVDMSRPWNALDSLQKWGAVAREHIDKLRVPPETLRELEHKLVRQFQEYTEPGDEGAPQRRSEEEDSVLLPLGDNTLTRNLGIPMVVVCTKCDAISTLEKEHDYRDEHLDFIQSHIRQFCLQYGASLVYTSVKEMKNLDVLYKYLVHRLYGFPFHCPAQVVERDAVFIPSGWDNEKKIAILHENLQTLKADDNFEEVIVKPPVRKFVHEKEIQAEDDQVFLVKLQSLLAKQPAVTTGRPVDPTSRAPSSGSPRASTPRSAAANVANAMPQSGQTSEGVLANFFNSLLTKKAGTGGPGTPGGGNTTPGTVRKSGSKLGLSDVQAELDRISNRESDSEPPPNDAADGQDT